MKCFLFPGQGSQTTGMGELLFDQFPELTRIADEILGFSIKSLCLTKGDARLNQTQYTQPAMFVVNALSYLQKLEKTGEKPDFVAGHSLGEYNALYASGAVSFEDGLIIVKKRGELMAKAEQGAMAAVLNMSESDIYSCLKNNHLDDIDIANLNTSTQIVISGLVDDIERAQEHFEREGAAYIRLNTSGAFHSRYMEPAKLEFEKFLKSIVFSPLTIPVVSNIHAAPYKQEDIVQNLANQITHSVKWVQSMQYLLDKKVSTFEELGSGVVLSKLITKIKGQYTPPASANTLSDLLTLWDNKCPVGSKVVVKGFNNVQTTRSKAVAVLGHRAAVYLEGYKGYFSLKDVDLKAA